jgi:ubiquinone/menaquinone biosynthesis C-methylase UbiE
MDWYLNKPKEANSFAELVHEYNLKYGEYNYENDARKADSHLESTFLKTVGNLSNNEIVICGANSGFEIDIIRKYFTETKITAVDISNVVLSLLNKKFPDVACIHGNMENISTNKIFHMYINCRAIHSSNVHLENALNEAMRISEKMSISIANGYLINNKIVNGMFDYRQNIIDVELPYVFIERIHNLLSEKKYMCEFTDSLAEKFIFTV